MNTVSLIGRLTSDPQLKQTTTKVVARFNLAVDKQLNKEQKEQMEKKGQPTADFINVSVWGQAAENLIKFTEKGKRVAINGRIQTGAYKANDGTTRYTFEVVASNVEFIDWKGSKQNKENNNENSFEFGADFDPTQEDERVPF